MFLIALIFASSAMAQDTYESRELMSRKLEEQRSEQRYADKRARAIAFFQQELTDVLMEFNANSGHGIVGQPKCRRDIQDQIISRATSCTFSTVTNLRCKTERDLYPRSRGGLAFPFSMIPHDRQRIESYEIKCIDTDGTKKSWSYERVKPDEFEYVYYN